MCDKLVFDLSQEVEGSPNVFIRKDWINILDNMNQNYQNNQCIIDTSQLANSNKYMAYREAYLAMPMLGTIIGPSHATSGVNGLLISDYSLGLKNWFGSMIHSFTLDYNGTTIIQQTPFINMWNIFKLLTSLSYQDVMTMGPTIGFYPDTSSSFTFNTYTGAASPPPNTAGGTRGLGVCNASMANYDVGTSSLLNVNGYNQKILTSVTTEPTGGNTGITYRTKWIAYNSNVSVGANNAALVAYEALCPIGNLTTIWKSYISSKVATSNASTNQRCYIQYSIMAIIYLRHVHSFFNMCPLLKGVFMKLTMNLNNTTVNATYGTTNTAGTALFQSYTTQNAVGGCCPILIPSMIYPAIPLVTVANIATGNNTTINYGTMSANNEGNGWLQSNAMTAGSNLPLDYNISVGSFCLNPSMATACGNSQGAISKSVYLYVPAYTFNPPFEQAYLSNSVKQIKYTDVYQYQYQTGITPGGQFNFLVTNGIANIKSVLIIPFLKQSSTNVSQQAVGDYAEYQSPFDTAGCGTTAPMVTLGNFNVQISGQNAIYNTQRYTYEEFVNQLYGQNSVNGGMTDGLNSGLINFMDFQNSYCYYYVNVERMLPVEQSVTKSVQVLGTNYSGQTLQFWIFIEYGVEVKIDVLTGARV